MKPGSALLSLVVGMLIASSVFIVLINSLNQFIKIDSFLNNNIDQTKRFIVACTKLENDLMGTCVPHQATRNKQKSKEQEPQKDDQKNKSTKNEKKPLKECFLFKGNPTDQAILSMITSNGKDPYWPKQTAINCSFLKRITYIIEKDPANKQSFRLMRYESADTTFIKPQKTTLLLDHIASITISASYRVHKKEKKSSQQQSNEKKEKGSTKQKSEEFIFKTTQQWNDSFVYEQEDTLISRIPDALIITYELFDNQFKNKSHHAQTISLISEGFNAPTKTAKAVEQIAMPPTEKKEETAAFPPPSKQKKQEKIIHNQKSSTSPSLIRPHYNQGSSFFNSRFPEIALQLNQ